MVGTDGDSARVVSVEEPEVAALAAFYTEAWGEPVSPETVRRNRAAAAEANPATPGRVPPAFLFMAGGRAVGHLGTIPVQLRLGGAESPAHWLKGLMVLPEHQNGPVGFFLLREATRACGTAAMALVVERAARRLYAAHGFADLGALPNGMKLLRPTRVLERLDLAAIGLPLPPWVVRLAGAARWPPVAAAGGAVLAAAAGLWTAARGGGGGSAAEAPVRGRTFRRARSSIVSGIGCAPRSRRRWCATAPTSSVATAGAARAITWRCRCRARRAGSERWPSSAGRGRAAIPA